MTEFEGPRSPDDPYQGYPGGPTGSDHPGGAGGDDPLVSRDYAEWWRRGMALVQGCWRALLPLAIALIVVTFAVQLPLQLLTPTVSATGTSAQSFESMRAALPLTLGLTLGATVVNVVLTAIIALSAVHVVTGYAATGRADLGPAIRGGVRRLGPMIGWALVYGLLSIVACCVLFIPMIYVYLVSMLLAPVVAFERTNIFARPFTLFNKDIGAALARTATVGGITIGVGLIAGCFAGILGGGGAMMGGGANIVGLILSTGISAIVAGLLTILVYPLQVVLYADLRGRQEPLTTEQLAAELAA